MWKKRRSIYIALFSVLLVVTAFAMEKGKEVELQKLQKPLRTFHPDLGPWRAVGKDHKLDERTLELLKPQDYLVRNYIDPHNRVTSLYIGFFGLQKEGQMIHSPRACLPGGGWSIATRRLVEVPGKDGPWTVNQLILGKDLDKISVLYWYQGRGKIEPSEYWERLSLLLDGVFKNRNDGALVRLTSNMNPDDPGALQRQVEMASTLIPQLEQVLP
jgi:EpsI family protein